MKYKLKKEFRIMLVAVLALTLISTGSLAWRDLSQHKTNTFETLAFSQNAVLVEQFEPVNNWKIGQEVTKRVFVKNGQSFDDIEKFYYTDAYVRVQLREFLGISKKQIKKTDFRLLTDSKGEFIKFDDREKAEAKANELKLDDYKNRVVELKAYNEEKKSFYIKVLIEDQLDTNGQYLVTSLESNGLVSLETNKVVEGLDQNMAENHNSVSSTETNIEDSTIFSTHNWQDGNDDLTHESNIFKEYVSWQLGDDVISLESWKSNYEMKPVNKWIVDTSLAGEGWVYWGMPLKHSKTESDDSKTSDLLESIKLIKEADGTIDYRIHINLDAVSKQSLDYWGNAPKELLEMYKK